MHSQLSSRAIQFIPKRYMDRTNIMTVIFHENLWTRKHWSHCTSHSAAQILIQCKKFHYKLNNSFDPINSIYSHFGYTSKYEQYTHTYIHIYVCIYMSLVIRFRISEKKLKTFNMSDNETKAHTQVRGFCYV